MSDTYGYDPYGQRSGQPGQQPGAGQDQAVFLGYDEYGQPVYDYGPAQQQPPQQSQSQDYGYETYGQQGQQTQHGQHSPYGGGPPQPYPDDRPAPAPQQTAQQEWIPQQTAPEPPAAPPRTPEPGYRTEEFSFVEEEPDDSEDVIDWLKFTENRTERRQEAKRRGRNRVVALGVVLALALVGGVGYLWATGRIPGLGAKDGATASAAGQQRDVIVVHLRALNGGGSSTALLVDNATAKRGNTVLLPNSLALNGENGTTTTLGKAVEAEGTAPTRESLGTLLGADIKGSWRLDTPYLENLVELVGKIKLDADVTVPGEKKGDDPLVERGKDQTLDGRAAVAYATYRGRGEPQNRQLERFGEVMHQTLRKLSSDAAGATTTVETLGQIPDPSLPEKELGASLAKLSGLAKEGSYRTQLLPVQANGTLSDRTSKGLVKQVLGGTVKNTDPDAAPRVKAVNASGDRAADDTAQADLVNSGYTVVEGGAGGRTQARSQVTYADEKFKAKAEEVAKTLGLPGGAVRKGEAAANADLTVVLGRDYKP